MLIAHFKPFLSFLSFLFISELRHLVVYYLPWRLSRRTPGLWWTVHFWSNGIEQYFKTTYTRQSCTRKGISLYLISSGYQLNVWLTHLNHEGTAEVFSLKRKQIWFAIVNFVYLFLTIVKAFYYTKLSNVTSANCRRISCHLLVIFITPAEF